VNDVLVILVVEDDLLIQNVLTDTLHDGGYEVAMASSGKEAIKLLDAQNRKYRALLTDIDLGRGQIDGWEVAKRARELEHDLPVVYMTGDSAIDWASKGVPNSVLITKPYAPAQILTAVSQLLNTGSTQTG
jgi:CheY-like chemotaxis protein